MNTGPANRHKHSIGGRFSTIVEAHQHDLTALEAMIAAGDGALAGRLDALEARIAALEAPSAPVPAPAWPWPTLQAAIDATPTGGTLDATGRTFEERIKIGRPMTLRGGTIHAIDGHIVYIVDAPDVTLEGVAVRGDGVATWGMGIDALRADRLRVLGCTVRDLGYAGIMVLESAGVEVLGCRVENIGVHVTGAGNAYGIAISNLGGAQSSDWIVARNRVDRVPNWHGIDTHAGVRGVIVDNHVSNCNRAIFVTSDSYGRHSTDVEVSLNTCDTPTPRADVLNTRPWNEVGITVVTGSVNVRGSDNALDGWPVGNAIDVQGSGAVFTGTVVTNPV